MYQMLVALDGDVDRAITQANYVASLPSAADEVEAILLFVFTEDQDVEEEVPVSVTRISAIRRADEILESAGIERTIIEDNGNPADDILAAADKYDVDGIVLGGRKRSPVGKAIFGSVTQSVILGSDHPVTVTGASEME